MFILIFSTTAYISSLVNNNKIDIYDFTAGRLIAKEAGIDLSPRDLKVSHITHRYRPTGKRVEYVDVYLSAEKWEGEIQNMEPDKCDGLEWFDLDNLPKNIVPELLEAFNNVKNGVFYSEFGLED